MFLSMLTASLVLPILAPTSTSVPPSLSITLPRYVNEPTSSSCSHPTVIGFSLVVLILVTVDLPLLIFKPVLSDVSSSPVVLLCKSWLCEKEPDHWHSLSHPAVSKDQLNSNFSFPSMVVLTIQSITRRNMRGDSKHILVEHQT